MDSRLLDTLNAQASSTRDPIVWARTVCRASMHFARHGMMKEAMKAISVVRAHYGKETPQEIASWLLLAEGVVHYFKVQTREAYERINRAYSLAVESKSEFVLPICAAWLANIEYYDCSYDSMVIHLEEAIRLAKPDDHQAHARAALTLADAYHIAGDYELARPWYFKARNRAADDGDTATLSAMLLNVAAVRASNVRIADTFGFESMKEANRAALEAASSRHYDHAIGTLGLEFLAKILRGVIFTIQKKYQEAIEMFSEVDTSKLQKQMYSPFYVDMAWCYINQANIDEADMYYRLAEQTLQDIAEADDLAYTLSRLSQISNIRGEPEAEAKYKEQAAVALKRHRLFQAQMLLRLNTVFSK